MTPRVSADMKEFVTPRQAEGIDAILKYDGNTQEAAKSLGISAPRLRGMLSDARARAVRQGAAPSLFEGPKTYASYAPDEHRRAMATDRQLEYLDALVEHGSQAAAAMALNCSADAISKALSRLDKHIAGTRVEPHRDPDQVPAGYQIKGTSAMQYVWDPDAQKYAPHWVKTDRENTGLSHMLEAFKQDCVPSLADMARREVEADKITSKKHLGLLAIGDPHFGMFAWGEETGGQDFDLKIAERQWRDTIDRAVEKLPYTHRAVLLQLGDLTHGNDHKNVTPGHGHHLDVDTRHQLVMRAAARSMFYACERMRERCDLLQVESLGGNHSPETVMALNIGIEAYFRREADVTVSMSARDIRHVCTHGDVMITASHGDKAKPERLQPLIAAGYRKEWGASRICYHHGGHVHHTHKRDFDGMVFESHRSPAPMDAHAAARYYSEQSVATIVYNEHRECERSETGVLD